MNTGKVINTSNIPRGFSGCVYVAELNNGVVKVGFSASPKNRISSLDRHTRKKYAARVVRFHIGGNLPLRDAQRAEKVLISKMQLIGKQVVGTIEYFHSVAFEDAVGITELFAPHIDKVEKVAA